MLKASKILAVLFLVVFGLSTAVAADDGIPLDKWWDDSEVSKELALTEQEKTQLEDKFLESRRKLIDLKSAVEKEKLELEAVMNNASANEAAVMKHFKKLETARSDLSAERFAFVMEVRKIIGFDRFQKLEKAFRDYKKRGPKKKMKFKDSDDKTLMEGSEKPGK